MDGCAPRDVVLREALVAGLAAGWAITAFAWGACACIRYCPIAQPVTPSADTWYQAVFLLSTVGPFFTITSVLSESVVSTEALLVASLRTRKESPSVLATRAKPESL